MHLGHVLLQAVVVRVAFITEVTGERFGPRVGQQVPLHIMKLFEPPLADGTDERSVVRINLHVCLKRNLKHLLQSD